MDPITTMKRTSATIISTRVKPRFDCSRSMLTVPPRWEGDSLPGSLRYITHQLRRLRPVRVVPPGRDVDLLATRHRDRIRDHPRAVEHRRRVGEGARGQGVEVLPLQVFHLDLRRHETGGQHATLGHAARPGRDHRGDRQDPDGQERERENHFHQAEPAAVPAVGPRYRFHRWIPHWTVTIPVGRTTEMVREYPSEFVKIRVQD